MTRIVSSVRVLCFVFLVGNIRHDDDRVGAVLLFPASSVLQITASLAVPVELPDRKIYMDWGYQFNWALPWEPSSFYDVPTFQRTLVERSTHALNNATENWGVADKYAPTLVGNNERHSSDFTAGELYTSLENLLVRYGFHETCLLRSVCELAHHPFADDQQNLLTEVLTFILTPSLHEAFADSETVYRGVYAEAELRGFLGDDCASLYFECEQNILSGMTRIVLDA